MSNALCFLLKAFCTTTHRRTTAPSTWQVHVTCYHQFLFFSSLWRDAGKPERNGWRRRVKNWCGITAVSARCLRGMVLYNKGNKLKAILLSTMSCGSDRKRTWPEHLAGPQCGKQMNVHLNIETNKRMLEDTTMQTILLVGEWEWILLNWFDI